jgi:hypothetical protein
MNVQNKNNDTKNDQLTVGDYLKIVIGAILIITFILGAISSIPPIDNSKIIFEEKVRVIGVVKTKPVMNKNYYIEIRVNSSNALFKNLEFRSDEYKDLLFLESEDFIQWIWYHYNDSRNTALNSGYTIDNYKLISLKCLF